MPTPCQSFARTAARALRTWLDEAIIESVMRLNLPPRVAWRPFAARLPVLLLGLSVVLVVLLAWQAQRAATAHRALAERVLRDYADVAATELGRRATSYIGNYGLGAAIRGLTRATVDARGVLPSREVIAAAMPTQSRRAVELIGLRFRFDPASGTFQTIDGDLPDEARRALVVEAQRPGERRSDYRVLPVTVDHRLRLFVFTSSGVEVGADARAPHTDGRVGFEARLPAIAQWFREFILAEPLLPPSLAARDVARAAVRTRVRAPDGSVIVRWPDAAVDGANGTDEAWRSSAGTVRHPLDDAADNSLRGFVAEVAIDPAAADALVIGGLPESRVGLLLALLLLSLGLTTAAVVQVVREQALARLRQEFVTRTSHELRTPVAQIRMFTDTLLLDRVRTEDERRRSLEAIDRGARRLAHLVDNVMQFARHDAPASAQRPRSEPIDLAAHARASIDEFQAMMANAPPIALHTSPHAQLRAAVDPEAFRQILMNLLDNAVKYSGDHARSDAARPRLRGEPLDSGGGDGHDATDARIRVCIAEGHSSTGSGTGSGTGTASESGTGSGSANGGSHRDAVIEISVEDRGPGIPAADRERVWLPYFRLDRDRQSVVAGAGIGLAVVRDLVTQHQGTARVDESPGGGTRIVITFPGASSS